MEKKIITVALLCLYMMIASPLWAQDEAELAKELSNPVADLISVPFQNNWDFGIGPEKAMRYTLTFLFPKENKGL